MFALFKTAKNEVGPVLVRNAGDVDNLPNFKEQTCELQESTVVYLRNCGFGQYALSEYMAIWKDATTGYTVVIGSICARIDYELLK